MTEDSEKEEVIELKPEWEEFCQLVAHHGNPTKQYRTVYPDSGDEAARRSASRLMTNADVKARIEQIRSELREAFALEREDTLRMLFEIIQSAPGEASRDNPLCELKVTPAGPVAVFPDMLGCIKEIHQLTGSYEPSKIDHTSSDGSMTPSVIERRIVDPKEEEE